MIIDGIMGDQRGKQMNSKEVLLAYINTLSDRECKKIYLMLKDTDKMSKARYEYYNDKAEPMEGGLIKLTPVQFHALVNSWGMDKVKGCFKILYNYLKEEKKVLTPHYRLLRGWVETHYLKKLNQHNRPPVHLAIRFDEIKTKAQARIYVAQVPPELRGYDVNVEYLVNRYGEEILCN